MANAERELVPYTVRPSMPDDRDALYEIHRAAMFPYVSATWGWDEEDQRRRFRAYFAVEPLQAIVVGEEIVGILHLKRTPETIEVVNIELHPEHQGKGIGARILSAILAEGAASDRAVELQVLKVNDGAHRLYQRMGFRDTGETSTHILMRRDP
jgi:ribosomal protein S18 acetylase RimI-like enzyme